MGAAPRFVLLAILVPGLALAGCIGAEEAPTLQADANETAPPTPDATLPDGRGEAIAFEETNVTEEGVGGMEHKHDYWKGETRVVIFEDDVGLFPFPVFPEGEGSEAKSIAYIKPPQPMLVYEGAASVEVLVQAPTIEEEVANPVPPSLSLQYRTASDEDFRAPVPVTYGTPVVLSVSPKETDMPHSVSSLWAFKLLTDKVDVLSAVNVTITAVKGSDVVDWPGHPEFYADRSERVVLDRDVKVRRAGIEEAILYGAASSWIQPDKLISYDTGYVDVFVNVTRAVADNGASPTGFFLEYHNATILHAEDEYNDRVDDEHKGRQFDHADYHFVVPVDPAGMDGPYQPSSRWGFRMVATFAETPAFSLCPGCFPYEIDFHITVIAHKTDSEQARLNE